MLNKKCLFDFLYRLNREHDEVCGKILGKNPLPSIQKAIYESMHKESRKRVMMGLVKELEIEISVSEQKKKKKISQVTKRNKKMENVSTLTITIRKDIPETHTRSFMESQYNVTKAPARSKGDGNRES